MAERRKATRRTTKDDKLRGERARQNEMARRRVERVAQTVSGLNGFIDDYIIQLESAMQEILYSADDVTPLRRINRVTRELKFYASMVKRDREATGA